MDRSDYGWIGAQTDPPLDSELRQLLLIGQETDQIAHRSFCVVTDRSTDRSDNPQKASVWFLIGPQTDQIPKVSLDRSVD